MIYGLQPPCFNIPLSQLITAQSIEIFFLACVPCSIIITFVYGL